MSSHQLNSNLVVMNEAKWQSLSAEQQAALTAAVEAAMAQMPQCVEDFESQTLEDWRANGTIEIVEDVDREAFRTKAEPYLRENFSPRAGRGPRRHPLGRGVARRRGCPRAIASWAAAFSRHRARLPVRSPDDGRSREARQRARMTHEDSGQTEDTRSSRTESREDLDHFPPVTPALGGDSNTELLPTSGRGRTILHALGLVEQAIGTSLSWSFSSSCWSRSRSATCPGGWAWTGEMARSRSCGARSRCPGYLMAHDRHIAIQAVDLILPARALGRRQAHGPRRRHGDVPGHGLRVLHDSSPTTSASARRQPGSRWPGSTWCPCSASCSPRCGRCWPSGIVDLPGDHRPPGGAPREPRAPPGRHLRSLPAAGAHGVRRSSARASSTS